MKLAYTEILNVFEGIYLSWDPKIFQSPIVFHGYGEVSSRNYVVDVFLLAYGKRVTDRSIYNYDTQRNEQEMRRRFGCC